MYTEHVSQIDYPIVRMLLEYTLMISFEIIANKLILNEYNVNKCNV